MSDAQHYRTKAEVAEKQEEDPIDYVLHNIYENKWATEKDIEKINKKVKEMVSECEKFAEDSPYPEKDVMYDVVYDQENYPFTPHKS
jgi:pyruvate dehydrogenase E1 component alpha subunit